MARVSRKTSTISQQVPSFKESRWGSYGRLSVKSNKKDDSIKHQLQMNREFIAKNITDGILAGEYYDDGVSGTTFVEVR
ncbi:hypothetical protein I5834_01700 [Clostridioides difficile]|nr:hypothetical protein [Clostridioides difficile]